MVSGTGVSQASMVQMMVMNQEIEVPTDAFIFMWILHRYYLFMLIAPSPIQRTNSVHVRRPAH
jgi:hypothetical protein